MTKNEQLFSIGDFSSANKYEDLVGQLQTNVDMIKTNYKTQKTDESSHLMSYLVKIIDNEEAKLKDLIIKLEKSDVKELKPSFRKIN